MIEKKANYSLFLFFGLLISVLLPHFPLTTAGLRVLLQADHAPPKENGSGKHGNDGNKMGVEPSHSNPAHSATDNSSPSQATPSWRSSNDRFTDKRIYPHSAKTSLCGQGKAYTRRCVPSRCRMYDRNCMKN